MKNGLLVCKGIGKKKNIGDYIQSVAQEQFFDKIDMLVEREDLANYRSKEKTRVIMNAWYMWRPQNFPPSDDIEPLYISMHIVPHIADQMLSKSSIEHLRKYGPIGARDMGTMRLLQSKGIDSYFSGCLTLTLGERYKSDKRTNEVVFVDPYYELGGVSRAYPRRQLAFALKHLMCNLYPVLRLYKRFSCEFTYKHKKLPECLDRALHIASFYNTYKRAFSNDILYNAIYLSHSIPQSQFKSEDDKMDCARNLIKRYAAAKLVITSRIHCALPSLGLDTPTIFITSDNLEQGKERNGSSGRFEGLIDLLNTMKWTSKGVIIPPDELWLVKRDEKISKQTIVNNKDNYLPIKSNLIERIHAFIKQTD